MLDMVKLLLGITSTEKDELLLFLIEKASDEARNITHRPDIDGLENVICDMVVYNYNRIGTEGLKREVYSGVTYEYTDEYPPFIYRQLLGYRKIIVC